MDDHLFAVSNQPAEGHQLSTTQLVEYRREVRRCIFNKQVLPPKHFYSTAEGSKQWLDLCRQSNNGYDFYADSIAVLRSYAKELVGYLISATGTAGIDLVSVGCGDGVKDNILLKELDLQLGEEQLIGYYAFDISDALISEARENAIGDMRPEHFQVHAFAADYNNLKEVLETAKERPAPRLFAALGNTAGNADEAHLIRAIAEAKRPADLVLLEVNIGVPDVANPLWRDPTSLEHDFVPLAALDIPFDPDRISFSLIEGQSVVEGTKSVLISYRGAEIDGEVVDEVKLFLMHYYDPKNFSAAVEEKMNAKVLWSKAVGDVYIVLAAANR